MDNETKLNKNESESLGITTNPFLEGSIAIVFGLLSGVVTGILFVK